MNTPITNDQDDFDTEDEQDFAVVTADSPVARSAVAMDTQQAALAIVDAASDKKAQDILLLDVRQISSLADYFVICSAMSDRQIRAVADGIDEALEKEGISVYRREGQAEDGWVLLDYGDIIVHVFAPQQREFYSLEELWSKATLVVRVQ